MPPLQTFRNNHRASETETWRRNIGNMLVHNFPDTNAYDAVSLATGIPRRQIKEISIACTYRLPDTWFDIGTRREDARIIYAYLKDYTA